MPAFLSFQQGPGKALPSLPWHVFLRRMTGPPGALRISVMRAARSPVMPEPVLTRTLPFSGEGQRLHAQPLSQWGRSRERKTK